MNDYPKDWPEIAVRIKRNAGWKCERCGSKSDVESGRVLTTHHLDGDKSNCEDWNLAALCQRCHLSIQGRVKMDQLFFIGILQVSEWFKPHYEGYLKSKERRCCKRCGEVFHNPNPLLELCGLCAEDEINGR